MERERERKCDWQIKKKRRMFCLFRSDGEKNGGDKTVCCRGTTCLIFTCGAVWMNPPGFKIWDYFVFKFRGQMKKVRCECVCFCTL